MVRYLDDIIDASPYFDFVRYGHINSGTYYKGAALSIGKQSSGQMFSLRKDT
jgi:hypothetical protein